uniref:Uncharacterized protein n=1 Tax=Anopheles melas TaxID=34690 RepID=A0A182UJI6_9DIPT
MVARDQKPVSDALLLRFTVRSTEESARSLAIAAGWFVVLSIFSSTSPALPLYTAAAVPFVADGPPPTAPRPTGSTDHAGGSDPLRLLLPPVDCCAVSYRIDRQISGKMMMQMVQMHQMMMVVQMVMVMVVMVQVPQPMQQMTDGGRVAQQSRRESELPSVAVTSLTALSTPASLVVAGFSTVGVTSSTISVLVLPPPAFGSIFSMQIVMVTELFVLSSSSCCSCFGVLHSAASPTRSASRSATLSADSLATSGTTTTTTAPPPFTGPPAVRWSGVATTAADSELSHGSFRR